VMGRVAKTARLPSDMYNDCRNHFSAIGPKTSARITGATGIRRDFIR
jgi:hypothetical protein